MMPELINPLLLISFLVALQACSTPYYGYTQEEWNNLGEAERLAVQREYQFIIDTQKGQTHKDKIDARTQSVIDRGVEGPAKK